MASSPPQQGREDAPAPPLSTDRSGASYDMVALEAKESCVYTIPSFSAITLKLKRMYVTSEDDDGVHYYDHREASTCT